MKNTSPTLLFITISLLLLTACEQKEPPTSSTNSTATESITNHTLVKTKENQRIVCLGDSLTAGYGLNEELAWPALIQEKINSKKLSWSILNAGKTGDTTAGGLRKMNWLLQQKIDILILALGANDGLRGLSPDQSKKNLQAIIKLAKKKNSKVKILIAGMQVPPNMGEEYSQKFRMIFPELAQKNGCILIPFLLEGVAGKAEFNQADGIHPSASGQGLMSDNIWKYLEPELQHKKNPLPASQE